MRVSIDTNVFISFIVFRSKQIGKMIMDINERHTIVLSSYMLNELSRVIEDKFPEKKQAMTDILDALSFEVEMIPQKLPKHDLFKIRDPDDEKILYSAIAAKVDVLITGDKDFLSLNLEYPEILTPTAYITKYGGTSHLIISD